MGRGLGLARRFGIFLRLGFSPLHPRSPPQYSAEKSYGARDKDDYFNIVRLHESPPIGQGVSFHR
jgi:hypothetical protein